MAYDSTGGEVVLYGGETASNGFLGDTWTFNGTNWAQQSPYASPVALSDEGMIYDSALNGVILYGGENSSGAALGATYYWNNATDTWESTWRNRTPGVRQDPQMATAPTVGSGSTSQTNGQIVLFSGQNANTPLTDTQILDWGRNGSGTGDTSIGFKLGDEVSATVDLGTGNLYVPHTLWNIANTGLNSTGVEFYNSESGYTFDTQEAYDNVLPNGDVIVNRLDGTVGTLVFTPSGNNQYSPAIQGCNCSMTYTPSTGDYTLIDNKSQTQYIFNNGYITEIEDRNGNAIKIYGLLIDDNRSRNVNGVQSTSGSNTLTTWTDSGLSRTWVETMPTGGIADSVVTDAKNNPTDYQYNSYGQLTQLTDPDGHITTFTYDLAGRIASVTQETAASPSDWPTTSFTWQAVPANSGVPGADYEVVVTDPDGNASTYIDAYGGQTLKVTDGNGNTETTTYDPDRQPQDLTNGLTQETQLTYVNNNLTQITAPGGSSADTAYLSYASSGFAGAQYLPSSVTDGEGNCSSLSYDGKNGNQTTTYEGLTPGSGNHCDGGTSGISTTNTYQDDPNTCSGGALPYELCSRSDANGQVTSYGYDSLGELTSITQPGGTCSGTRTLCTSFTYDGDSRLKTETDGKGQVTTYKYDNEDHITKILYNGAPSCVYTSGNCITYTYDANGNLTSRDDVTGLTTFTYDDLNRLTNEELPSGASTCGTGEPEVVYGYDAASNLTSYCDGGGTVTYAYDKGNRMVGVATGSGSCTPGAIVQPCSAYVYSPANQLTSIKFPTSTGVTETYNYDQNSGSLQSIAVTRGSTSLAALNYSYQQGTTNRPLLQSVTNSNTEVTTSYYYTPLEFLKSATGSGPGATTESYTYDNDGDMLTEDLAGATTTMTYNSADEMCWAYSGPSSNSCTSPPNGATTYKYDADGNQLNSLAGEVNTYNTLNQAASMTSPTGGTALDMTYTGVDNTLRTAAGSTTYINNAFGAASMNNGTPTYFIRDPAGRLNSMYVKSSGQYYYYFYDGIGNVIGLIDASGNQVASYSYDPYGNTVSNGSEAGVNPYQYEGGSVDSTTYIKFGARYYSPMLGSWTQQDPASQTPSYSYTAGDPVNYSDSSGRDIFSDVLGAASSVFSAGAALADATGIGAPVGGILGGISVGFSVANTAYSCAALSGAECADSAVTLGVDAATLGVGGSIEGASSFAAGFDLGSLGYGIYAGS